MDLDTAAPRTTLADRAAAAYEAATLEHDAETERLAAQSHERMVADAAEHLRRMFGDDTLGVVHVDIVDDREVVVAALAGVELVVDPHFPRAPRGLVACPLCRRPRCRTNLIVNRLEHLGRFITEPDGLELLDHEAKPGVTCDGLNTREQPDAGPRWQTRYALNAVLAAAALNDLDGAGYDGHVVANPEAGYLIVGRQRRNEYVYTDDDPF